MRSVILSLGLLLVLAAVPAAANVQTVVPGVLPRDYDSAGDLLVFVGDGKLWTVDVTDPSTPFVLGSIDTPGGALGVKLHGTQAIVAGGYDGISLFDISDPTAPALERTIDLEALAVDVDVLGSIAYVAAGQKFCVVDISDTATPPVLGCLDIGSLYIEGYWEVFVDPARPGQVVTLFLATNIEGDRTGVEVRVLDVTDPSLPSLAGVQGVGEAAPQGVSRPVTLANVDGFAIVGKTSWNGGPRIDLIDVSVSTAPVDRGEIWFPTGYAGQGISSAAPGTLLWSSDRSLRSVDISDPDNILIVDEEPYDLRGPMHVVGMSAFHGRSSMDILDVSQYGPGVVGVEELGADGPAWVVSPNPTRGATTLRWSRVAGAWTAVDVLDVAGRRVASLGSRWTGSGAHTLTWDGRDGDGRELAAGVYYLSITSGEERLVRKVVRLP